MEKTKRDLWITSVVILVLTLIVVVNAIIGAASTGFTFNAAPVDGLSKEIVQMISIIVWAISLIILIPQIYVGYTGMRISKGQADPSKKGHLIWAIILAIFSLISVITSISNIANSKNFASDIINLVDAILSVLLFGSYVFFVRKLSRA